MTNTIGKINNWSWDSRANRVKRNEAFLVWTDEVTYIRYISIHKVVIVPDWDQSVKREQNFNLRERKRKCNETLDGVWERDRKVCIYFTWRRGISARIRSVETDRLFKFVHELSSHPLALNNCSLRLVFSYLGHTHTCTSIACRKVLAILSLRHAL